MPQPHEPSETELEAAVIELKQKQLAKKLLEPSPHEPRVPKEPVHVYPEDIDWGEEP